jgi:outer membrane protein assembly factor BamB
MDRCTCRGGRVESDKFVVRSLWSNPDLAVQFNTPLLKEGLLFGLSDRNDPFCIDAKTGRTVWTGSTTRGSRGFGSIVDAGAFLVVLANDSQLVIVKPDRAEYREIKQYKAAETVTYAHPVIAGKRIFVKDETSVTLWIVE